MNYASYQNNVPLVRAITLTNATNDTLPAIEVGVRCEPEFAEAMCLRFERLVPGETRRIDALNLKSQHRYLAELNEAWRIGSGISLPITAAVCSRRLSSALSRSIRAASTA